MDQRKMILQHVCRGAADEALFKAILDRPDNDSLKLAYAQWLEERRDPRAAYLRDPRSAHLSGRTHDASQLDPAWLVLLGEFDIAPARRWEVAGLIVTLGSPPGGRVQTWRVPRGRPRARDPPSGLRQVGRTGRTGAQNRLRIAGKGRGSAVKVL
jgi:uncharacterized protein (TIGR02996 family)